VNKKAVKIYLFCCSSSFDTEELKRACNGYADELKIIALPCSGKVDILYLTKAFETGADGVAIVTCEQGKCHYLEGNFRARKRAEAIESLLEEIGMAKGRIAIIQMKDGGLEQIIQEVKDFSNKIRAISRNN
jgi:F420-non-reducing hydrogenase iron-sulfur subunit